MVKSTFTILATLSLAAMSLMAQSGPGITVNVPFDFVAGTKVYPAGTYSVQADSGGGAVAIRGADSKANQFMLTRPVYATEATGLMALRFNRYGDRYFLSQVWTGDAQGRQLGKSRAEREQIAAIGKSRAVVSLTALR